MAMEIESATPHPHQQPNPHQRKIELQSPLDLTYLQSNIAAAARQKLDLHFPPSACVPAESLQTQEEQGRSTAAAAGAEGALLGPGEGGSREAGSDPMRRRVEDLLSQFLARMWEDARANVVVNGQDATGLSLPGKEDGMGVALGDGKIGNNSGNGNRNGGEGEREGVDFEYEPYDSRLSGRVAALYAELEALTMQVSRLRRTAPGTAAERDGGVVLGDLQREAQGAVEVGSGNGDRGSRGGLRLKGVREGWEEDVAAMYERGLGELRRLGGHGGVDREPGAGGGGGTLTETVGRVQRAKMVALELE